ncbi:MAG TPA: metal-dependent hydrolase [Candidatus Acidoferrales bacterium]|nr:metal-dependent hydrolase [Candidatus Acidoferrales bacterium]
MDPITHGIAGALLGKAFFSKSAASKPQDKLDEEKRRARITTRVAILAATAGAMFPDIDVIADVISHDPLAIVRYHRGITHSFFGLPFFAVGLAALTRWITRRWRIPSPSFGTLTLIYGVGILSHILLDGTTSFGTRMLTPFSQRRVAWDWIFIIDFVFTSLLLLPQLTAWIYRERAKSLRRAITMWALFSAAAAVAWRVAQAANAPFHMWIVAAASAVGAALFFGPAVHDWGFSVSRARWCQTGVIVTLAYVGTCGLAHHQAMRRVRQFAKSNHVSVVRIGALPVPPSMLDWGDAIRTADGVYSSRYDLRQAQPAAFRFAPDSARGPFMVRALGLPEVHLYWNFARFPVIRTITAGTEHVVIFEENRFVGRRKNEPQPFTYSVVFDGAGDVVEQGWIRNGMLASDIQRVKPQDDHTTR